VSVPRRCIAAFVLLGPLLAVAGCGDSDADSSATPTATLPDRSTTTARATPTTAVGEEDFTAILRDLLARRDEAYETNDVTILETVYAGQCACLANGRRVIEQRLREGVHTEGERLKLLRAEVASRVSEDLVFIRGVVSQGPNNLVDNEGRVVRAGETHGPVTLIYEAQRTQYGWRILGITEEGAAAQ
jgi:hypothetical protein